MIPLELCVVPPGQIVRKQMSPDQVNDILGFSTMAPRERFDNIREGLAVCLNTMISTIFVDQFAIRCCNTDNPITSASSAWTLETTS